MFISQCTSGRVCLLIMLSVLRLLITNIKRFRHGALQWSWLYIIYHIFVKISPKKNIRRPGENKGKMLLFHKISTKKKLWLFLACRFHFLTLWYQFTSMHWFRIRPLRPHHDVMFFTISQFSSRGKKVLYGMCKLTKYLIVNQMNII